MSPRNRFPNLFPLVDVKPVTLDQTYLVQIRRLRRFLVDGLCDDLSINKHQLQPEFVIELEFFPEGLRDRNLSVTE